MVRSTLNDLDPDLYDELHRYMSENH
jgi:hypothetical protein